ncbi:hypothetical protein [Paraburkholderia sp. UCT2]|uniref:hypothetical protein n=1 Tax=Paraburkholderia sp. UCT2 TaxID=2615208 RepID=UPI0016565CCD|nr:hypothetical protein [Paraburkholderia sp. UCT2]MBC8730015.1 hypothetical protein [Paraburkholderia sp. UCT2]
MNIARVPLPLNVGGVMHMDTSVELCVDLPAISDARVVIPLRRAGSLPGAPDAVGDGHVIGALVLERALIIGPQLARYALREVLGADGVPADFRGAPPKTVPPILDWLMRLHEAGFYPVTGCAAAGFESQAEATLADVCATNGDNWEDQLEQRAREMKRMKAIGIPKLFPGEQGDTTGVMNTGMQMGNVALEADVSVSEVMTVRRPTIDGEVLEAAFRTAADVAGRSNMDPIAAALSVINAYAAAKKRLNEVAEEFRSATPDVLPSSRDSP